MPFTSVLDQNKLDGTNFNDWYRNPKIILKHQKKENVLMPSSQTESPSRIGNTKWGPSRIGNMKKGHESDDEPIHVEQRRLTMELMNSKMAEGASVDLHVQGMIDLIEELGKLDSKLDLELCTDVILQSLPSSFSVFIKNYFEAGINMPLSELRVMLSVEQIRQSPEVPPRKKAGKRGKGKNMKAKTGGKGKARVGSTSTSKLVKLSIPTTDKCSKKSARVASSIGINVVEINFAVSGAGAHICGTNVKGLIRSRKLAKGEMQLKFDNGA